MKNGISLKTFVLIFAVLALIVIFIGFSYDTKGYASNILAEITGLFLSIIVAILLVERFTENQQKKRWERVRKITHRSISHHLSNILLELFNHFPLPDHGPLTAILDSRDQPNIDTANALANLIEQIKELIIEHQIQSYSITQYFNSIKSDIAQIRHDLMPRVLQSSDNQELINTLVEFDDTTQELQNNIIIQKRLAKQNVIPDITLLLEKIRDIYKFL